MTWGNFVTAFISFLILAFVLFPVIKKFMAAQQKEEEAPVEEPKPSDEVVLLQEIRNLLSKQAGSILRIVLNFTLKFAITAGQISKFRLLFPKVIKR